MLYEWAFFGLILTYKANYTRVGRMVNRWLTLFIEVLLVFAFLDLLDEAPVAAIVAVAVALPVSPIVSICVYLPNSKIRTYKFIFAFIFTVI